MGKRTGTKSVEVPERVLDHPLYDKGQFHGSLLCKYERMSFTVSLV